MPHRCKDVCIVLPGTFPDRLEQQGQDGLSRPAACLHGRPPDRLRQRMGLKITEMLHQETVKGFHVPAALRKNGAQGVAGFQDDSKPALYVSPGRKSIQYPLGAPALHVFIVGENFEFQFNARRAQSPLSANKRLPLNGLETRDTTADRRQLIRPGQIGFDPFEEIACIEDPSGGDRSPGDDLDNLRRDLVFVVEKLQCPQLP